MIPAAVVVGMPPGAAVVPQGLELRHGLGPLQIHILQKPQVCLLAVILPVDVDPQGLVQQILFGRHDVYYIPKCLWIMPGCIHVDVDAAAVIDLGTPLAKLPDQLLYGFDILILADRGHDLHGIQAAGRSFPPCLTADTGVTDHLPLSACAVSHGVGVVGTTNMGSLRSEMLGNDLRRRMAGNACHLDFNAKVLFSQPSSPSFSPTAATDRPSAVHAPPITANLPPGGLGCQRPLRGPTPPHRRRKPEEPPAPCDTAKGGTAGFHTAAPPRHFRSSSPNTSAGWLCLL